MPQREKYQADSVLPDTPEFDADPILKLKKLFDDDPRPDKINAGIGEIADEKGNVWVPYAVKIAELRLAERASKDEINRSYLVPIGTSEWSGHKKFIKGTTELIFGDYSANLLEEDRIAAAGTVGSSYAIAAFLEAIKKNEDSKKNHLPDVIMGSPSYGNHKYMMDERGFQYKTYDQIKEGKFNLAGCLEAIEKAKAGDILLFQGGAHNPTGINPESREEWLAIAKAAKQKACRVFFDIPYAGLDKGLQEDTEPVRIFMDEGIAIAVAVSYSKNAGLYNKRVGALLIPTPDKTSTLKTSRLLNRVLRKDISSPSAEGEEIIAELLSDPELREFWDAELFLMTDTLQKRRNIIADALESADPLLSKIIREGKGIFSTLPITPEGVEYLQKEKATYMLESGRINIGGITTEQAPRFAEALKYALEKFRSG